MVCKRRNNILKLKTFYFNIRCHGINSNKQTNMAFRNNLFEKLNRYLHY